MTQPRSVSFVAIVTAMISLPTLVIAQPSSSTVSNGEWTNVGTGLYDTGVLTTDAGGIAGQTSGPYFDTSFGVMNEAGTPWFTGNDLLAQQYVQQQAFGNLGSASPSPNPWGHAGPPAVGDPAARHYNYGYGGTTAGSNFPTIAAEKRSITVNHWNNTNPDSVIMAAIGQQVYIPASATLEIDMGWGGDEMLFDMIGGLSGPQSKFRATVDQNASYDINGTGSYTGGASGEIIYSASMQDFDAGPGNAYRSGRWGLGPSSDAFDTSGSRTWEGTTLSTVTQGIPPNSIGTAISEITGAADVINLTSSNIIENGGTFSIDFESTAELISFVREFGEADGRVSFGPGMQGSISYRVNYDIWEVTPTAVPEPGSAAILVGLAMFVAQRRRR